MAPSEPVETFVSPPDPGAARTLDELAEFLRSLKLWAGDPSFDVITDRVNTAWASVGRPAGESARRGTVVDCFRAGRRRVNIDLLIAVVRALHPDDGYAAQWRQALRVVLGETRAAAQVRAQDTLPADLAEFTGRSAELGRLRDLLRQGRDTGGAVVISAIEGMAGVGKTQLAVHAGHVLAHERPFDRVLFVNLRGFHPDPAQPPADPAAVLDSFLRLLGVPGQEIPHDLTARTDLYRRRLTGRRVLIVLDNAAHEDQVRPLLPDSPRCLTLITSRRHLSDLSTAAHLALDVFTPDEALDYLKRAVPDLPLGDDADALVRIAGRCGHLPLALGLVAAQMRTAPGWTVTDHADRLDERHRRGRLDDGVELALSLSYQGLPPDQRRLLRLLALHPGQETDRYVAAALADIAPDIAAERLRHLCGEHLLQEPTPDRYVVHDLVRAYGADRAADEDRPADRRAAMTRLLDHYLYAAATALDTLHPAERDRRPRIPPPATPTPPLADPEAAGAWLDTERANLVTATVHAATNGWPDHATRLAATLFRYLDTGSHYADADTVHSHARNAARHSGDRAAEATALTNLGNVHGRLGRYRQAAHQYEQAVSLFGEVDDRLGEARARGNLGMVQWCLGNYQQAADHQQQAVALFRDIGDRFGQAVALTNLGNVHERLGRYQQAADHHHQAVATFREIGERFGEAGALIDLGIVNERMGRYQQAADHHQQAHILFRDIGDRQGMAATLTSLGVVHERLGRAEEAADHHLQALTLYREIGDPAGEGQALNGLGEARLTAGQPDQARGHHTTALDLAEQTGDRYEQARAHRGLAHTYRAAGDTDQARHHWQEALARYAELDVPEADQVRAHLADLDGSG